MAVFRSDQSQLTYAMESAPGGDVELNNGTRQTSSGYQARINGAVSAGSTQIVVDGVSNTLVVGDFIRISDGLDESSDAAASTAAPYEIRRVEHATSLTGAGTLFLDRPLGFNHIDNGYIIELTAVESTTQQHKVITEVPGAYESITVPDMVPSYEPRYFLGVGQKRDWTKMYVGAQSFSGSLPGFIPLSGKPFRWAIGDVFDVPSAVESASTDINGAVSKGDIYVTLDASHGYSAGDFISFSSSATTRVTTSVDDVNQEVKKIAAFPSTNVARLERPFRFDHPDDSAAREVSSGATVKHHIIESVLLDTMTWHLHMRDSGETAANDFDRRYVGGFVGSSTISADEGGMLMCSWDTVQFLDMMHNQAEISQSDVNPGSEAALTTLFSGDSSSAGMPRYSEMASISTSDAVYPSTEPYYFSQGSVKIMGQEFARVRNFNLSISNGEEPRYYISPRHGRHRGPSEIREGRRSYGLSCTLALPDSGASASAVSRNTATEFFKQLLIEGNYGSGMEGFNIELTFTRGTNDSIQILIPADYTSGDETTGAEPGLGENGAFLTSAPLPIGGDPILQVSAEFSCRNLKMIVTDTEKEYT
tara:strand:- start:5621 stop:7396 length:1776 start_codon:yes stop_codon:yes gene_type:complete